MEVEVFQKLENDGTLLIQKCYRCRRYEVKIKKDWPGCKYLVPSTAPETCTNCGIHQADTKQKRLVKFVKDFKNPVCRRCESFYQKRSKMARRDIEDIRHADQSLEQFRFERHNCYLCQQICSSHIRFWHGENGNEHVGGSDIQNVCP
ncbi:hypothetical protein MP228_002226 [Amoeboaphelidium protococcarum]|nr:hypothetical protein MP228_002226 [Amoeboaphelidium protococcarum]